MRAAVAGATVLCALVALPSIPAEGAFPGRNGLILFTSNRTGKGDIYGIKADGTGERLIVGSSAPEAQAAWSPDGRSVAFRRGPDHNSDIFVASSDGSGVRQVTESGSHYSSQPAWSADGTRIYFRSDRDGDPDVWVTNLDGSGQHVALDLPGDQRYPTPSPDGRRIAFRSDADGDAEVFTAAIDGSDVRKLTDNTVFDSAPSWSPDSRRIAFERMVGSNTDVYVMDADGSGVRQLTDEPLLDEGPVISPDGRSIVFTSERDGGNSETYLMGIDGSGQRNLTRNSAKEESPDWQAIPVRLTLRVAASPRTVRSGTTATIRFTVTVRRFGRTDPVAGARVSFAGRSARTDANGVAVRRKVIRGAPRVLTATATLRGYATGTAHVRVVSG